MIQVNVTWRCMYIFFALLFQLKNAHSSRNCKRFILKDAFNLYARSISGSSGANLPCFRSFIRVVSVQWTF